MRVRTVDFSTHIYLHLQTSFGAEIWPDVVLNPHSCWYVDSQSLGSPRNFGTRISRQDSSHASSWETQGRKKTRRFTTLELYFSMALGLQDTVKKYWGTGDWWRILTLSFRDACFRIYRDVRGECSLKLRLAILELEFCCPEVLN